jgi:mono/diheme cytochrome c family protein
MTSQNPTKTDAETLTTPEKDDAQAAVEQPGVKQELTDEQIAAVAGGVLVKGGNTGGSSHSSYTNPEPY